jgi:hypothetical protein
VTVSNDVDAILKLVRQKEERGGDLPQQTPKPEKIEVAPEVADTPPPSKVKKPRTTRTRVASTSALAEQIVLENVTTRLRRDTNELLTEAALRQKLKKEDPSTRQDIIEEALQDWFQRQAYALSKE